VVLERGTPLADLTERKADIEIARRKKLESMEEEARKIPQPEVDRTQDAISASISNDGADSFFTIPLDVQECGERLQTLSAIEGKRALSCWQMIDLSNHLEYSQVDISF
jgi:hypothetical protein